MYGQSPIRPSRLWYWVAAGLVIAALACVSFAVAVTGCPATVG